ncbi:putative kinase Y4mE [Cnuibacter physcomitrellae]|uniref:Uncharacterized protein n=1 Tax=Cnuibacter physcomitrellae TaxID=1619308 RepID=A0A1X9LRA2_9MICO|nr:type II toxin-antitoxin system HipA family toxin [Cnuibacter physcomitrellae]ARJ06962.1 hypothetical protein B5808_18310 [Cnuibacter physcomitrellae]GGI39228.1 putative kinase Y4mE [Cnuibacter physcomitrellae]
MRRELVVLLGSRRAGTLRCEVRSCTFEYDSEYVHDPRSTPLSLSMPLRPGVFESRVVDPYLWGLLPDNPETLQRWAILATPPADEHNPFSLLEHYGRDCAGAVQFVSPEEFGAAFEPVPTRWLSEKDIGDQLRALRRDPNAWTFDETGGRFSLAGAQAKFALLKEDGRWGRPQGATPTTHILKPGIPEFPGSALDEHLCMSIAAEVGLPTARSTIETFDGEVAIVVERYDRIRLDDRIERLHQEDFCQALAVMPSQKYQSDGGPGLMRMTELLRRVQRARQADATAQRLLLATAFDWVIAGTDAHAKNYSLLLRGAAVSMAPLYDVASYAPFPRYSPETVSLAQKVDGRYRMAEIGPAEWRAQAAALGLDPDGFLVQLRDLLDRMPRAIERACLDRAALEIDAAFTERLREALLRRTEWAAALL